MTPAVIFGSINLTKSIAEYLGLIESTNSLLNKSIHEFQLKSICKHEN